MYTTSMKGIPDPCDSSEARARFLNQDLSRLDDRELRRERGRTMLQLANEDLPPRTAEWLDRRSLRIDAEIAQRHVARRRIMAGAQRRDIDFKLSTGCAERLERSALRVKRI